MNWEAIAAIAEIVGAIAIVVTLVYVADQIRHARIATTDENRHHFATAARDIHGRLISSPELRGAYEKFSSPAYLETLQEMAQAFNASVDEASLVMWQNADYVWMHSATFRSLKSSEDMREFENIVLAWYSVAPMGWLIKNDYFRAHFDPEFVAWVDKVLGSATASDS